jgi:hypothetical protein
MIASNLTTKKIQGSQTMPTDTNNMSIGKLAIYTVTIIVLSIATIELGRFVGGFVV